MYAKFLRLLPLLIVIGMMSSMSFAQDKEEVLAKGKYLVTVGGCNDCHTAAYPESGGKVAESDWLKGSLIGYQGPWGTSYAANLRLAASSMTEEQFMARSRSELLPPMPWFNLRVMSDADLVAIYQYIKSLGNPGQAAPTYVPPGAVPITPFVVFVPQEAPSGQ